MIDNNQIVDNIEELLTFLKNGQCVCPQPQQWNNLWKLLPNRKRVGAGWEPPLPLVLSAWAHTSDDDKRTRFHYHLKWAAEHGVLPIIIKFIKQLPSDQWHYAG